MTPLEHADRILSAQPGDWLIACEAVTVTNMRAGGTITIQPGERVRVRYADGVNCSAMTEAAERVGFGAGEAFAFERTGGRP